MGEDMVPSRTDEEWEQAGAAALDQLRLLLSSWDAFLGEGPRGFEFGVRGRSLTPTAAVLVFGLAAHCHELARVVVAMEAATPPEVLAPTVRAMMEAAVAANWVLKNREAGEALARRAALDRQTVAAEVATLTAPYWRGVAEAVPQYPDAVRANSSSEAAKKFHRMCDDFEGAGTELYLAYRALSWYSHAGIPMVDLYFEPIEQHPRVAFAGARVGAHGRASMLMQAARAVLWAGGAVNAMDKAGKVRGSQLRAAGRALKLKPVLNLTVEAERRVRTSVKSRSARPQPRREAAGRE